MPLTLTEQIQSRIGGSESAYINLFSTYGIDVIYRKATACPCCGGNDRFVFDNKYGQGDCHCRGCGGHMNFIALIAEYTGSTYAETAKRIASSLGIEVKGGKSLSNEERREIELKSKERQFKFEEKRREDEINKLVVAKKVSESFIAHCSPATNNNPYLVRKKVKAVDGLLRTYLDNTEMLVVPYRDINGELFGIEVIGSDKKMLPNSSRKGCFFTIKPEQNNQVISIVLCEGIATGLSLSIMHPCSTILVCGYCHNLVSVAKSLVSIPQPPDIKYMVAGDIGNGSESAEKAGKVLSCEVKFPEFPEGSGDELSDFNDFCNSQPNNF